MGYWRLDRIAVLLMAVPVLVLFMAVQDNPVIATCSIVLWVLWLVALLYDLNHRENRDEG